MAAENPTNYSLDTTLRELVLRFQGPFRVWVDMFPPLPMLNAEGAAPEYPTIDDPERRISCVAIYPESPEMAEAGQPLPNTPAGAHC